jgi:hypothetical protein
MLKTKSSDRWPGGPCTFDTKLQFGEFAEKLSRESPCVYLPKFV